jgi:Mn2+/Fe2+ NRAMP family transporter
MINAWLILLYPYTMMEKRLYSRSLSGKVDLLHRARWDFGVGVFAAGVVALPLMACAASLARPFGIVPRSYMDLSVLLEPVAGRSSTVLFLGGLFLAAWTSGVGWWVCGAYALCDLMREPIRLNSRPMRTVLILFFIPSVALLLLHIDPVYQIIIFAAFLTLVFPVVGLALLWRITRPDMGYFRWSTKTRRGKIVIALDIFAIAISLYVGAGQFMKVVRQIRDLF